MATVVLPVLRSPMISSRWPRPIGVMASMALMPVCSGSCTGLRPMIPGAWTSMRRVPTLVSGPLPSTGSPRVLTTRPRRPSPHGHREDLAGGLDRLALLDGSTSPSTTAPMDSSSRFRARPIVPSSNSSISLTAQSGRPPDAGDAVADLEDAADRGGGDVGREALQVLAEGGGDVVDVDGQLGHGVPQSVRGR